MFQCQRCGSRFNATIAAASENCPRCQAQDGVVAPVHFRLFEVSALQAGGLKPQSGVADQGVEKTSV